MRRCEGDDHAVDTNVLIDVFAADARYLTNSLALLQQASKNGQLVVCEVVLAEVARYFSTLDQLLAIFDSLNIIREPIGDEGCFLAGRAFLQYRKAGGPRDRVLADFLIAGHAQTRCDRLLTRDRGFYRTYFQNLTLLVP